MPAGRSSSFALSALLALALPFLTSAAEAGVGGGAGGVGASMRRATLVRPAQYYRFDDQNYCWYAQGWQGPGWYLCGDEWDIGVGWGGPYGWNRWGRSRRSWPSGGGGVGAWHRRPPPNVPGVRPAPRPGVSGGGAPHAYHSGGAVLPSAPLGGAPSVHSLPGVGGLAPALGPARPAFHGFGGAGGEGVRGFGGGGSGFHGFGGGAFSPGGHGGHAR